MKHLVCGLAAAVWLAALAGASAQEAGQPPPQTAPGTAGMSKPGVAGKPGSKSGAAVTPNGQSQQDSEQQAQRRSQDQTGVPSKPGTEAGQSPKNEPLPPH